MRVIIYARVSTEEQARTGFSLTEQIRACRERAAALAAGAGAAAEVTEFTDDTSGEVLERPGLQAALDRLRPGGVDCLVCLDPDRLARRLMHQLLLTDEIERSGCRLEFVQHDYQQTAEGRLFYQMRGAIAEFEKAKILERTARGQRGKIAAGGLPHMIRLYGYRFVKGAGKQAPAREALVPDPREVRWVELIFRWCTAERLPPGAIARRLNDLGVPTKTGRSVWRSTQVRRLLTHPAYATGLLALGRHDCRGIGVARRLTPAQRALRGARLVPRVRPREQWRFVQIEPLVDGTLWEAAQQFLGTPGKQRSGTRLLTGLGRCGVCGGPLHYLNGSKIGCGRRYRESACTLPAKDREAVEAAVLEAFSARGERPLPAPSLEPLRTQLDALEKEAERLGLLFARGLWPAERVLPALEEANRKAEALRRRLAEPPASPPETTQNGTLLRQVLDGFELHPSGRGEPPLVRCRWRL